MKTNENLEVELPRMVFRVGKNRYDWLYYSDTWDWDIYPSFFNRKWKNIKEVCERMRKTERKLYEDVKQQLRCLPEGVTWSWTYKVSYRHYNHDGAKLSETTECPQCTRDSGRLNQSNHVECILHFTEAFTRPLFEVAKKQGYFLCNWNGINISKAENFKIDIQEKHKDVIERMCCGGIIKDLCVCEDWLHSSFDKKYKFEDFGMKPLTEDWQGLGLMLALVEHRHHVYPDDVYVIDAQGVIFVSLVKIPPAPTAPAPLKDW